MLNYFITSHDLNFKFFSPLAYQSSLPLHQEVLANRKRLFIGAHVHSEVGYLDYQIARALTAQLKYSSFIWHILPGTVNE